MGSTVPEPRTRLRGAAQTLLLAALLGLVALRSFAAAPAAIPSATPAAHLADPSAPLPRRQILHLLLRSDPSQEYLLYVPGSGGAGAPVFVSVHGISRNFEEHATLFAPFAEAHGMVLVAPFFTAVGNDDYQRLGSAGRGGRSDLILDAILDEVQTLTGASTGTFCLFGFSGGAQFTHRYALVHPERIARALVGAAGWYMFPDSGVSYPYGLGASAEFPDFHFDPERFLRVPITVFVGGADTGVTNVRRSPDIDRQQGTTRRERAQRWVDAMRRAATSRGLEPRVTCVVVPGIKHSFRQFMEDGELGERVFAAFADVPERAAPASAQVRR